MIMFHVEHFPYDRIRLSRSIVSSLRLQMTHSPESMLPSSHRTARMLELPQTGQVM